MTNENKPNAPHIVKRLTITRIGYGIWILVGGLLGCAVAAGLMAQYMLVSPSNIESVWFWASFLGWRVLAGAIVGVFFGLLINSVLPSIRFISVNVAELGDE